MAADKNPSELDAKNEELRYGWFGCTPKWLQKLNTALWFMIFMALANTLFSGTVNGLSGAVQSSVETRFELSSTASSWIMTAYEFGTIPMLLIITYLGSKGVHRPRWVAAAMAACTIGIFLYCLPHFTTDTYRPGGDGGDDDQGLCNNRTDDDSCDEDDGSSGSLSNYLSVFVIARLIMGAAGVPLALLGMTFLDDCLPAGKFTLYSAIFAAGGIIGPALGFIVGGGSLVLFTDWITVDSDEINVEPGDPRWVGAWWVGFCGASILLLINVIPLAGFPQDLPGAAEVRANKKSEAFNGDVNEIPLDPTQIEFGLKEVPQYLKDIFTNWSFVLIAAYICCDMAILAAFTAFGPKYVEVQYSLTPAEAGILFGAMVVPAGAIGTISAGLIVDKFSLTADQMMKLEAFLGIFIVLMGSCLLVTCNQADFAGVNVGYNSTEPDGLVAACNANCSCDRLEFSPVCGTDNVQYFSACHAGCADMTEDPQEYYNCSCISYFGDDDVAATNQICSSPSCNTVPVFAVMMFFAMVGLFMAEAMNISLVIRVVPNTHRLFAMMTQSILLRLIGTVPGPLMFGAAFDASCLLWQETCGERGSCFHYDNSHLAMLIYSICISLKIASVICMFLAWYLYKPPTVEVLLDKEISVEEEHAEDNNNSNTAIQQHTADPVKSGNHHVNGKPSYSWSLSDESVQDFLTGTKVEQVNFIHTTDPNTSSHNGFSRDYTQDDVTTYL